MIKHVYSKHMFMGYQYDNFKDLKTYLSYFTFLGISSLLITTFSRIIHFFAQKSIIVRCQIRLQAGFRFYSIVRMAVAHKAYILLSI